MVKLIKKNKRILTLDISSTNTGYAFWADDKVVCYGNIKVKGDYSRLLEQGRVLRSVLQQIPLSLRENVEVWVEEPFFSRKGSTDTPIKMTHGILLQVCQDMLLDYCWNFVHVSTWRSKIPAFKGVKGSKNLKAKAIEVASAEYNLDIKDDNAADALCILIWARGV